MKKQKINLTRKTKKALKRTSCECPKECNADLHKCFGCPTYLKAQYGLCK